MLQTAQIESAYHWAIGYAQGQAPRPAALSEEAHDAATDAILWAINHWQPERGSFEKFAATAVRLFVKRAIKVSAARFHQRPSIRELPSDLAADSISPEDLRSSAILNELPSQLRDAVRFFYVDRFSLRECALLLGCSMETVRQRLRRAARRLDPKAQMPRRRKGEKRMTRR